MTSLNSLVFSYHAQYERAGRIALIDEQIGWGQIVKEVYYYGRYHFITDTGIALVVDDDKKTIVTLYMIDTHELCKVFNYKVPQYMVKRVAYNIRMGWVNTYAKRQRGEVIR